MKIKLWTKYNVGYLPPRCRKLRYREEEEYIDVEVKEITATELEPAFDTGIMIYSYNDKLWRQATERDIHGGDEKNPMTALDALIYAGTTYSTYFGKHKGHCLDESTREQREDVVARAEADMSRYIIVDGALYTQTYEPMYYVITFGLGHNHAGIGTSLSITQCYNDNISKDNYFNALEYDKAVERALSIAIARGDTDSVSYIKTKKPIRVFDEKFVTRNPQAEHGNGNEFLSSLEAITEASSSASEAGLLVMALAGSVAGR